MQRILVVLITLLAACSSSGSVYESQGFREAEIQKKEQSPVEPQASSRPTKKSGSELLVDSKKIQEIMIENNDFIDWIDAVRRYQGWTESQYKANWPNMVLKGVAAFDYRDQSVLVLATPATIYSADNAQVVKTFLRNGSPMGKEDMTLWQPIVGGLEIANDDIVLWFWTGPDHPWRFNFTFEGTSNGQPVDRWG